MERRSDTEIHALRHFFANRDTQHKTSPSSKTLTEASVLINLQLPDAVRNDRTRRDLQGNIAVHLDVVAVLHTHLRIHVQIRSDSEPDEFRHFWMDELIITQLQEEHKHKLYYCLLDFHKIKNSEVNYLLKLEMVIRLKRITHTFTEFPRKLFSPNTPPKLHCFFFFRLMVHELVVKILSFTTASSSARFCSCFTSLCCMSTCLMQRDAGRVSH